MARVTVEPQEFTMVFYDAARLTAIAEEIADLAGLGDDVEIRIEVDEASPFGSVKANTEGTNVVISAESAAFEDARNPRHMSERATRQVLGRVFTRIGDRLDPQFGSPPNDDDLTYEQQTAWDAYALGRLERHGTDGHKERRRYHFRIRHGFTDVADRVFDRLWAAENLSWADIDAACAETSAARPDTRKGKTPKAATARP